MHYFRNFKNYTDSSINLFSNFTILIGKNGSGKSNLIEGVELLAALAEGKPLYEMVDGKGGSSFGSIRGGIHSCVKFGENTFSLGFEGHISFLSDQVEKFDYCITIAVSPFPSVVAEHLIVSNRKIFMAEPDSAGGYGMLNVVFDNFARGGIKPHKKLFGDRSVISRYEELVGDSGSGKQDIKLKAVNMVFSLKRYIQSSYVFDPTPKLMRDYVRVGQNVLLKDGSNISAVLHSMSVSKDGVKQLDSVLKVIRQIPEEPFLEFDFAVTSQHDVLMLMRTRGREVDARLISDGTLRAMAVITALESIPKGSRVVIEEFDNGLHPSRAELLLVAIRDIVKRKRLNILMSTHNPASLNSLTPDLLSSVHVCYWDSEKESSKLARLLDIPKIDSLLESQGGLGDLVTKSIFERHLEPQFEAEKKARAKEWLRQFSA